MFKRISAVAMAICLTLPAAAATIVNTPAAAPVAEVIIEPDPIVTDGKFEGDADAEKMSALLLLLKERFLETDGYDTFDYYIREGSDGTITYNFNWSDTTGELPYLSLSANEKGFVKNYSMETEYNWQSNIKLPKLTKNDAVKVACAFIKKIAPDYASDFSDKFAEVRFNRYDTTYSVTLYRYRNGYAMSNESVSVTVNEAGEICSYYAYDMSNNVETKSPRTSKNDDALIQAFKSELPMKLKYHTVYDSETELYTIGLSYFIDSEKIIDAKSGKSYGIEYEYGGNESGAAQLNGYGMTAAAVEEEAPAAAKSFTLSNAEQSAVDLFSNLLTADDIVKLVKANDALTFDDRLIVESSRTYVEKSIFSDLRTPYINVYLSFEDENGDYYYCSVTANAQTGELRDYYYTDNMYSYYNIKAEEAADEKDTAALLSFDDAKPKLAGVLGVMYPDYFGEYVRETEELTDEDTGYIGINYKRYVNGIVFENDYINVTVDRETEKITSLNVNYSHDAKFASTDDKIDGEAAIDAYFKEIPVKRSYIIYIDKNDENYVVDTYSQSTAAKKTALITAYPDTSVRINALTGELEYRWNDEIYEYNGDNYFDASVLEKLLACESGDKLAALYNVDILNVDADFDSNAAITRTEYQKMLNSIDYTDYSDNEDDGEKLMWNDAVTKIIDTLGYGKVAKLSAIFKENDKFADVDPEMTGYFIIADALGLLDGIEADESTDVTVSDAVALIYNFIILNTDEADTTEKIIIDDAIADEAVVAVETSAIG